MTNWKALVEKTQAETYVLPEGWESRATIAGRMDGISEEKARQLLAPMVKSGVIEMKSFAVFDRVLKKVNQVVAYREKNPPKKS